MHGDSQGHLVGTDRRKELVQGLLFLKAAFLRVQLAFLLPSPCTRVCPGPVGPEGLFQREPEQVCVCRGVPSEEKGVASKACVQEQSVKLARASS